MVCTTVAIAGNSSEVGKTTLLCDLLREFPGWEAIKMTRGHRFTSSDLKLNLPTYATGELPKLVPHVSSIYSARIRESRKQGS